jgi:hypothetical protein
MARSSFAPYRGLDREGGHFPRARARGYRLLPAPRAYGS